MIRRRRRLRDRQKRMIGLILRTTLHVHPPFLYIFFAVTAYLRRENAQFHVVRRNFLILSERAYGCLKFNPSRAP